MHIEGLRDHQADAHSGSDVDADRPEQGHKDEGRQKIPRNGDQSPNHQHVVLPLSVERNISAPLVDI